MSDTPTISEYVLDCLIDLRSAIYATDGDCNGD